MIGRQDLSKFWTFNDCIYAWNFQINNKIWKKKYKIYVLTTKLLFAIYYYIVLQNTNLKNGYIFFYTHCIYILPLTPSLIYFYLPISISAGSIARIVKSDMWMLISLQVIHLMSRCKVNKCTMQYLIIIFNQWI